MRSLNLIPLLFCAGLIGCSRAPCLPAGVTLSVKDSIVFVTLAEGSSMKVQVSEGSTVLVRQDGADPRSALVAHMGDRLSVIQMERGGETPRSMGLISRDRAEFSVDTGPGTEPRTIILDHDGDGLPDLKIEGKTKFQRMDIAWAEIPKQPSPQAEPTPR